MCTNIFEYSPSRWDRELGCVASCAAGRPFQRLGDIFRDNVFDSSVRFFVFEVIGTTEKVDAFISLMKPPGLVEVSRTGVATIARGSAGIEG
jgi:acetolactate synthase small subunit